ncbi:MAG TPA: small ribosomal subunit Rsm22 family protein [Verrucomicrobiae bacterium]|nr:small ribosomal subunit Rsm22 family protein [Verrucomicrobiae bacterium]
MTWENVDWKALQRLRAAFLDGSAGGQDYWRDERDLTSYDLTFAQRIAWKWDYVLNELKGRGWQPPHDVVADWGCGTGIATRAFLAHFGTKSVPKFVLWDRSPLAMQFAARKTRGEFPDVSLWLDRPPVAEFGTLLVSHVLTELSDDHVEELLATAIRATSVIWIEPGTYEVSRRLIAARERLRATFQTISPCPHQAACGMLSAENARHWCHHFASSPPEVFTDGGWARFAKLAGVDLRSLPLSFLVLDKRPPPACDEVRVIGRPRIYKAHALALGCDANGVREYRLTKRDQPKEFHRLKKGDTPAHMPRGADAHPEKKRS